MDRVVESTRPTAGCSLMPKDPTTKLGAEQRTIATETYGPALEQRYVLFFDFLGASEAATRWPPDRVRSFIDLLSSIAKIQSPQDISGGAQADGSFRIKIVPETTTFSDNVVVSYPEGRSDEPGAEQLTALWAEIVCSDAIRILLTVAEMGLPKRPTHSRRVIFRSNAPPRRRGVWRSVGGRSPTRERRCAVSQDHCV